MRKLSANECKNIQLKILKYIDEFCSENHIKYYLCGGTLIGAIRHKGFIPWDDDIDIMLPRPEYNKFLRNFKDDKNYKLLSLYNQPGYFYPYIKIVDPQTSLTEYNAEMEFDNYGIYVDVFPIDGLPKNKILAKLHFKYILILRNLFYLSIKKNCPKNFFKKFLWIFSKLFHWNFLLKKIDKLSQKYDFNSSNYVAAQCAGYGEKDKYSKDIFKDSLRVPFEKYEFNIPIGYNEYLSNLYGDYMKLPPKSQRKTRHNYSAYLN